MSPADESQRIAIGIKHGKKMREKLPFRSFERKILLVIAHDGDQHLFRQGKELGIKATDNHRREFGEVYYGIEQRFVFAPAPSWNGARGGIESLADLMFTLGAA